MGRPKKNVGSINLNSVKKADRLEGSFDVDISLDPLWEVLIKRLNKTAKVYGFSRIQTPYLESVRLYENFYQQPLPDLGHLVFTPYGKEQAVLRPDILPSVLRAFCENKVADKIPFAKWFYSGQTYKQSPVSGLPQQDLQFGFELLGNFTHLNETQTIAAVWSIARSFGLADLYMEINFVGDAQCQKNYSESIYDFLCSKRYDLCDECNEHLKSRVLNVFRCNNLDCQAVVSESPSILDFLDEQWQKHFTSILEALDELGIPYQLNPLHIGPAGFSRTNLALKTKHKDKIILLGEAGYHDLLIQQIYGKNFSGFGFTGSLGKLREALESLNLSVEKAGVSEVFLVPLGELAAKKSLRLFQDLTVQKIIVHDHFGSGGVKNQLKAAEIYKAPIALIMGQKEAMEEMVILRDVKSGMQEIISYDKIVEEVKKRLGR